MSRVRERERNQGGSPSHPCRFRLGEGGFRRRAALPLSPHDPGRRRDGPAAAELQRRLEPLAGRLAGAPDAIGGGAIEHVQGSLLATGAAKRPAPGPEH
jgi:hypothetical protein